MRDTINGSNLVFFVTRKSVLNYKQLGAYMFLVIIALSAFSSAP
jgi:hypothetical protein